MGKSIENIWKQGFVEDKDLSAPKIRNLYEKKSQHIVDKMHRTMHWNAVGSYAFALVFFAYSFVSSLPIIPAAFCSVLFIFIGWYTERQLYQVKKMDSNLTSYEYLVSFRSYIQNQLDKNIGVARFLYPAFFAISSSIVWFADGREKAVEKLLDQYPNHIMIGNMPLLFLVIFIVGTTVLFVFAKRVYMFDVRLIYGRIFKKLDEIIADLEELRS